MEKEETKARQSDCLREEAKYASKKVFSYIIPATAQNPCEPDFCGLSCADSVPRVQYRLSGRSPPLAPSSDTIDRQMASRENGRKSPPPPALDELQQPARDRTAKEDPG